MMAMPVIRHIMIMIMRMCNRMRMRCSVMGMREGVLMHMRVMPDQGISNNKRGSADHNDQCDKVHP